MIREPGELLDPFEVPQSIMLHTADQAHDVDSGTTTTRDILPTLAAASLCDIGAPTNTDGGLITQAGVLEQLARHSLSIPFSLWGHRMVIEFLTLAGGDYATAVLGALRSGALPGGSAMAPGYKSLTGSADLDLYVQRGHDGRLYLSGRIGWASNLFHNAIVVAPAYGPESSTRRGSEGGVVVAFSLDAAGVEIGPNLDILAMRGTASTYVALDRVEISADQMIATDFMAFLHRTRPTLSILQASLCLGLATASYEHAVARTTGVHAILSDELKTLGRQLAATKQQLVQLATRVGTDTPPQPQDVLAMRLRSGQLASELAALETKTAGGRAFITTTDTNRRYREATFIPLQAPSEAQLRWELSQV